MVTSYQIQFNDYQEEGNLEGLHALALEHPHDFIDLNTSYTNFGFLYYRRFQQGILRETDGDPEQRERQLEKLDAEMITIERSSTFKALLPWMLQSVAYCSTAMVTDSHRIWVARLYSYNFDTFINQKIQDRTGNPWVGELDRLIRHAPPIKVSGEQITVYRGSRNRPDFDRHTFASFSLLLDVAEAFTDCDGYVIKAHVPSNVPCLALYLVSSSPGEAEVLLPRHITFVNRKETRRTWADCSYTEIECDIKWSA